LSYAQCISKSFVPCVNLILTLLFDSPETDLLEGARILQLFSKNWLQSLVRGGNSCSAGVGNVWAELFRNPILFGIGDICGDITLLKFRRLIQSSQLESSFLSCENAGAGGVA
jgi:hypothetical protein